jgi:hypothetical protein
LATSEDFLMATCGDFLMATDKIAGRTGVADGSLVADYTWPIDGYEPPQRPVSA